MTFEYVENDQEKAREIRARVLGYVPCFTGEYAIDRTLDAIVVALGGQAFRDPGDIQGPGGFFNLLWGAEVYAAEGYTHVEEVEGGFVTVFLLAVSAPHGAESNIDDARRLMELGLGALRSGYANRKKNVRVVFTAVTYR